MLLYGFRLSMNAKVTVLVRFQHEVCWNESQKKEGFALPLSVRAASASISREREKEQLRHYGRFRFKELGT
jgi:hypothetical protein